MLRTGRIFLLLVCLTTLVATMADAAAWIKKRAPVAKGNSIVTDTAGNPHLAYTYYPPGEDWQGVRNQLIYEWFDGKRWKKRVLEEVLLDDVLSPIHSSIAIDGEGRIHIVYARNSVLRHAVLNGDTWAFSDIEPSGTRWDGMPVVLTAPDGRVHLYHIVDDTVRHGVFNGSTWETEKVAGPSVYFNGSVISGGFLPDGAPVVAWKSYLSKKSGSTWEPLPGLPGWTVIATASDGTLHALYEAAGNILYYAVFNGSYWDSRLLISRSYFFGIPISLSPEFQLYVEGGAIQIDEAGRPHITFEVFVVNSHQGVSNVGYAFLDDGTWSGEPALLLTRGTEYRSMLEALTVDRKGIPHIVASHMDTYIPYNAGFSPAVRYFRLKGPQLSVKVKGKKKGAVTSDLPGISCGTDCRDNYFPGTSVTLTAVPNEGYRFLNWDGACSGTEPTCTVTLDGNLSVKAVFGE